MKQGLLKIIENTNLAKGIYSMVLEGDVEGSPGQFINIKLDEHFLRRPISICDCEGERLSIIYKVLGQGTEEMTRLAPGDTLDVLTGLGKGYDLEEAGGRPLLVGGGVGVPPLYMAAKMLRKSAAQVTVILGFNTADEIYYVNEFEALGCRVVLATADGSQGVKGFVTDAFDSLQNEEFSYFYTCGPGPMLKAVYDKLYVNAQIEGQMSFEERMGCGFGACMGCSTKTKNGNKRICKEGPVLQAGEVVW